MRLLGNSGLRVSAIGLGTVKIGRLRGLKYPGGAPETLPTDEAVAELLRKAAELGVNLIDTAPAYGVSEERLGTIMRKNGWFGGRGRWVVCTKAGEEFDDASAESRYDFSGAAVRASVKRSLARLGVDVLDIVLVHSDGRDEWIVKSIGAMEALERLRDEGKVRVIGVSTKSCAGAMAAIERLGPGAASGAAIMATYNVQRVDELPAIRAAAERGVGVLIKKGLDSGHAVSATEAVRFVLRERAVASLIVGTTSPEHLRQNAAAASGPNHQAG